MFDPLNSQPKALQNYQVDFKMIGDLSPKELAQHVSDYLGTVSNKQDNRNENLFFQKKIVLKEESAVNLKVRYLLGKF